ARPVDGERQPRGCRAAARAGERDVPGGAPARTAPQGTLLAYITGASSGIGQALAARYYRAGWRLALVARRGAEVQAWAQAQGWDMARVAVHAADVRDIAAITGAGRDCIAAHGLPDVVIANAGISVGMDTAVLDDL